MTQSMACKVVFTVALICNSAAHAEIIYSGASQNIIIDQSHPTQKISITGSDSRWDDLAIDLKIWNKPHQIYTKATAHPTGNGNHVQTAGTDGMVSKYASHSIINASINYTIRPSTFFSHENSYTYEFTSGNNAGNFLNETGYIGLQLSDHNNTYFGWVQVTTENFDNGNARLIVHDWAYNSTSGQAIRAGQTATTIPEPASLSILTVCSGGLLSLRRILLI